MKDTPTETLAEPIPQDQAPPNEADDSASSETAHLDQIALEPEPEETPAPEGEADGAGEESPSLAGVGSDGFMTAEAFYHGFCKSQELAGHFVGLETLKHAPGTGPGREASDAIYETCREVGALHWMIRPGGRWIPRLMAIAMYGAILKHGIEHEMRARVARDVTPEEPEASEASAA